MVIQQMLSIKVNKNQPQWHRGAESKPLWVLIFYWVYRDEVICIELLKNNRQKVNGEY